jgi:hypothetical protein
VTSGTGGEAGCAMSGMIWPGSCLTPTSDQRICGKRTVTPKWPANGKLRTREYVTEAEVERLMAAAKGMAANWAANLRQYEDNLRVRVRLRAIAVQYVF